MFEELKGPLNWSEKFLGKILDFCLPPALPFVFENCIFSSSRKSKRMLTVVKMTVRCDYQIWNISFYLHRNILWSIIKFSLHQGKVRVETESINEQTISEIKLVETESIIKLIFEVKLKWSFHRISCKFFRNRVSLFQRKRAWRKVFTYGFTK